MRTDWDGISTPLRKSRADYLEMLRVTPISVDPATETYALSDTLQLARGHRLSAYDASYLELALRSGAPLATVDADLMREAPKAA